MNDSKAWSLSKKSSDKEKERSKLLSALAKKPAVSSEAMSGKTKKVANLFLDLLCIMSLSLARFSLKKKNSLLQIFQLISQRYDSLCEYASTTSFEPPTNASNKDEVS